jgi:hypothetical protein
MKRNLFFGAVIVAIVVLAVGGWTVRGARWALAG